MYEEKIPFKRLGTVEEGYGQERQAAGKQIQILNTGNQTVTVKAVSAEGYVVGIPEGSITISDMTWNKWLNQITFGKFFNKTQKVEITAHDTGTGIANIVYYVAEGEQSVEQLNALPNGKWNLYKKEFTVEWLFMQRLLIKPETQLWQMYRFMCRKSHSRLYLSESATAAFIVKM